MVESTFYLLSYQDIENASRETFLPCSCHLELVKTLTLIGAGLVELVNGTSKRAHLRVNQQVSSLYHQHRVAR